MSFTDLERGLSTPPISPDQHQRDPMKYSINIPASPPNSSATRGNAQLPPFMSSSSPPPARLPSGLQVTRGNSRDSIGLGLGLQNPLQQQRQPTETSPLLQQQRGRRPLSNNNNNVPHPPSSPPPSSRDNNNKRSSKSPIAQHSRFVDENTRIDTPRPTLTPTTAGAVSVVVAAASSSSGSGERIGSPATSSSSITTTGVPLRSPQSVSTSFQSGNQNSNYSNRVLGNNNNRQVLSPPTSPPQFSPQSSPLNQQYRGFIRVDNRGSHDPGATTTNSMTVGAGAAAMNSGVGNGGPSASASMTARVPNSSNGIDTFQHEGISTAIEPSNSSTSSAFPTSSSALQEQELDYDLMVRHLSQQIFNISSNIAVLERLVPCLGQRHKDTAEMRASLHAVLDGTQELVKSAHGLVKVLARYHQPPSIPHSGIGIGVRSQQQIQQQQVELTSWQKKVLVSRRQTHQRLTKDLALVSKDFQVLQREAIEAERCQVAILRRLSSSASMRRLSLRSDLMDLSSEEIQAGALSNNSDNGQGSSSIRYSHGGGINNTSFPGLQLQHDRELSIQEEALLKELLAMDGELAMQETILQERESEIRKIEEGMVQVLDVMKELGTLVHEQRGGVDFLQDNIMQARGRIQQGQQEIVKASEHQRRSREKLCYIIMVVSTVGAIVMLAFVST
ncbi:hypothetical protein EC991_007284 [Linnemannia zychae]|nr:hypothetical protein EC991_007284 [Linnemannia zychae]